MLEAPVRRIERFLAVVQGDATPRSPISGQGAGMMQASPISPDALVTRHASLTDGSVYRLLLECLGEDVEVFPDGRMLIWNLARHDGYNIPPYPMAGCGDVKEFLRDEGARNVPDWYAKHLHIGSDVYEHIYRYELVMVRNSLRYRRVWMVPSTTMSERGALGGPLAAVMLDWARFALGAQTNEDDERLFKR